MRVFKCSECGRGETNEIKGDALPPTGWTWYPSEEVYVCPACQGCHSRKEKKTTNIGELVKAESDIENIWSTFCRATRTDPGTGAPGYSTWRKTKGRLYTQMGRNLERAYLRLYKLRMENIKVSRIQVSDVLFQLSEDGEVAVSDVQETLSGGKNE